MREEQKRRPPAGDEGFDWRHAYRHKLMSARRALRLVQRGNRVFLGSACAEPRLLVQALLDRADELHDVELLHFITLGRADYTDRRFDKRFRHNAFFIGPTTRRAVNQGQSDYTPVFMHEVPRLFFRERTRPHVALIQVSPPDRHGFVSLGIGVDVTRAAVFAAHHVVAQVNRHMPRTMGESFLRVDQIDALVEGDEPLMEFIYPQADEVGLAIARQAAKLVEDGDCLRIGYGHIPYAVLSQLKDRRDLGMHTEVVSDAVMELIEAGVITGKRKSHHPGRVVCSFCIGSQAMYRYLDQNPHFLFLPSEHIYNPREIARNDRMVSFDSALEVDLTGQVSNESHGRLTSGFGGRLDFMRGASMSEGGKPVVLVPSTTRDGQKSRIVPTLGTGAGVVATRGDVHYVVTEYGIAYLHGRSIRERALALISIAHPKFRAELLQKAKENSYVYQDQIMVQAEVDLYPEWAEVAATLKDGTRIKIRPIRPTDEVSLQEFFYSHSEETVYNRYFRPVRAMPHTTAQGLVNLDYDRNMALVAVTGPIGRERIIGVGRYIRDKDGDLAEVAFTVHEDYQGLGLGALLQHHLAEYAKKKGVKGFWALSFGANKAMLSVFGKLGPYKKEVVEPGIWRVEHRFDQEE